MNENPILSTEALGFPWACRDPFLFCAYHGDAYPAGNAEMGPQADLSKRNLGQDFDNIDGWNMYHAHTVPGFPQHPHRGFETVTIARQGFVDHADSLGAAARYGQGDAQWLTTGAGIVHSEMFPLLKPDAPNPGEAFQIWLNLAPEKKLAPPRFSIVWSEAQPRLSTGAPGSQAHLTLIAGSLAGLQAPPPPPDSWASAPGSEVVIATLKLEGGARWSLPAASPGLGRGLYFFKGRGLSVGGTPVGESSIVRLRPEAPVELAAAEGPCELLLLQGRPIGAPVAQYGPFVMNTRVELEQAFADYQRTGFGGWAWGDDAPVHPREAGRFARFADGREERPGKA
jgi:redox-sensitive bicupin YhaK (pirin superfamily)